MHGGRAVLVISDCAGEPAFRRAAISGVRLSISTMILSRRPLALVCDAASIVRNGHRRVEDALSLVRGMARPSQLERAPRRAHVDDK